ncbi:DUF6701 domain-containing protein [Vibrio agarivorans]|uniref:DUF6701 domain-containing protein n=1 Tax=Vibrio agarivorans TaxID=153622 RepID=UPI0022300BB4|nr:DUF6701 domain-containing protein [Vibrio agarivorans]
MCSVDSIYKIIRACGILLSLSLFSEFAFATIYDLADPNVSLCSNGSLNGLVYTCSNGDVELKNGDAIIFSGLGSGERGTLNIAGGSLKLDNNTTLGSESTYLDVIVHSDSIFKGTLIYGDVTSNGGQIKTEAGTSVINGNVYAHSDVVLKQATVYGNVISAGGQVKVESSNNSIFGNVIAHNDVNIKQTLVCGMIESKGGQLLAETQNRIYAPSLAVKVHNKATIKNSTVCGSIESSSNDFNNSSFYCGVDEPGCSYEPNNCPSDVSDICSFDEPPYVENPKYDYGLTSCSGRSCSVSFPEGLFEVTPIVILGPKVDTASPDSDGPSTTTLTSVSPTGFSFSQVDGLSDFESKEMDQVSYFAMEPGKVFIDDHEIVAGYLKTNKIKARNGGGNVSADRDIDFIRFIDFNGGPLSDYPVVLHQLQTQNNPGQWMTSGKLSSNNFNYDESIETRLFIELSATGDKGENYKEEVIGFIATSNSEALVDGENSLIFGLQNSRNQGGNTPLASACEYLFDTGLDSPTGLIVKKRSRNGGHGGWARLCQLNSLGDNSGKFSAVIDEDQTSRAHIPEELGYFAFESPAEANNYYVQMTPQQGIALTCESIEVQIQVVNQNGALASDFSGTVTVESGDTSQVLSPSDGVLDQVVSIDSNVVSEKQVFAYITGNRTDTEQSGLYDFVPYKLAIEANPLGMIAGKPERITIRPMECDAGGQPITSPDYAGERSLELSHVSYKKPSNPHNKALISITDKDGNWINSPESETDVEVIETEFIVDPNGEVSAKPDLIYPEAGEVSYDLTDKACVEDEIGDQTCKTYSGTHTVKSRPWTFAICEESNTLPQGTSAGGDKFITAGEWFDLVAKPIRWQPGTPANGMGEINASKFCDDSYVTQNFYKIAPQDDAPAATVEISSQLHTPSSDNVSVLLKTDNVSGLTRSNTDSLIFNQLYWNEVGSLTVKANSQNTYLGMNIDTGFRNIGRFYPAYFVLEWSEWDTPDKQGGAAYLGQPYDMLDLEVYAYSAKDDYRVSNYSKFSASLQATFPALQGDEYAERITGYEGNAPWEESPLGSVWKPRLTNIVFEREEISSYPVVTSPDGPFNVSGGDVTELELVIASGSSGDPVSFSLTEDKNSALLPEQPPARYGRMALADVSGSTSGSIRVPLRVEYFDGSSFVVNNDDDASGFDHNKYCTLDGVSTDASFSFDGTDSSVSSGTNNNLLASRSGTNTDREAVRLFLRQGEVGDNPSDIDCGARHFTQPWLQYNWRDKGDEDPSTLVTFGVYRGNDRIIFRGEPGLTGQ